MKQLGNLAIVCAQQPDLVMKICDGKVNIHADTGSGEFHRVMAWDDDGAILGVIRELNFGGYDFKNSRRKGSQ